MSGTPAGRILSCLRKLFLVPKKWGRELCTWCSVDRQQTTQCAPNACIISISSISLNCMNDLLLRYSIVKSRRHEITRAVMWYMVMWPDLQPLQGPICENYNFATLSFSPKGGLATFTTTAPLVDLHANAPVLHGRILHIPIKRAARCGYLGTGGRSACPVLGSGSRRWTMRKCSSEKGVAEYRNL